MTSQIASDELAFMRTEAQTRMPTIVSVYRPNTGGASDGAGGVQDSASPTLVATTVCKVSPASAREQAMASKLTELFVWNVRLPALTDCQMRDILQIPGQTLQVIQVLTRPETEIQRIVLAVESR